MALLPVAAPGPSNSASPPPLVAWAPGRPINTALDLEAACQSPMKSAGKLGCFYFMNGVINDASTTALVAARQQGKPPKKLFCPPPTANFEVQSKLIVSTISQNLNLSRAPAGYVVRVVYAKNWLCRP